jgi:hypothetical protein
LATLVFLLGALLGAAPALAQETPSGDAPPCEPSLEYSQPAPFWETYGDYLERRLTVDETVQNLGSCVPCALRIEAVDTDGGVSVETPLPLELGELTASEGAPVRIRYYVPPGVNAFHYRLRAACAPVPPPPVPSLTFTLEPAAAYANDGCPPSPVALPPALPEPAEDQYGPRRFIATLRDAGGLPVAGHEVKWRLSNPIDFSIMESSGVTDAEGNAYAVVSPPLFFICVSPYFDRGATLVEAVSPDSVPGSAVFFYTRCAPLGAEPPWTESQPLP